MILSHGNRDRREEPFFIAMAVAMALVVFIGFSRSFYLSFWLEPDPLARSEPIFYVHGAIFTAWMALLIVQPTQIALGRITQHRKLGWLGAALAIAVVVIGFWAGFAAAARPPDSAFRPKDLEFLCVILFGILMFGLLVGLAFAYRHDAQFHKRFMILATINLLQPAIVRIPLGLTSAFGPAATFLAADAFILPMVVWDIYILRRIHPATLWGGLAIVASLPLRNWMSGTQSWLSFAGWVVDQMK